MNGLTVLEYDNQRILLTSQLADGYGCSVLNIQQNFNNHKERFVENKHYYKLEGAKLKAFKNQLDNIESVGIGLRTASLMLWTEKGALRHAKILDTDMAWEVYEQLEETYFKVREKQQQSIPVPQTKLEWIQLALEQEKKIVEQEKQLIEAQPKAEYCDKVLNSTSTFTTTDIAKRFNLTAMKLNNILHNRGIQYKQGVSWYLYKQYATMNLAEYKTVTISTPYGDIQTSSQLRWTELGRKFIFELLNKAGYLNTVEVEYDTV